MSLLLAGTAATVVSAVVTRVVELAARRRGAFDEPNERSSHTVPTPRLGGLGIIAGVSAVALIGIGDTTMVVVLVGATLMGVLGLIDDLRGIPAIPKLASQVALATGVAILAIPSVLLMLPGAEIKLLGTPAVVVAVGWIVLVSNAVNFMDGTDGLIATSLFIAATAVALAGSATAVLFAAIAGACLGFLVWNRPPASIFMGDAGSQYLGFLFAGATLIVPSGPVPFGAILLAPLLFDVILTLLRRAARGAPLMTAHREHLYQRIADVRGHGFVALLFGAATGLTAIAAHLYAVGPVPLQALALALGLLAVAIVPVIAHLAGKPSGT